MFAIAIEKRLESEIGHALEMMGHVRDRPDGLNEAGTKAAFIDPTLSVLGGELRDPFSVSQQYRHELVARHPQPISKWLEVL